MDEAAAGPGRRSSHGSRRCRRRNGRLLRRNSRSTCSPFTEVRLSFCENKLKALCTALGLACILPVARAEVCNIKVVTDASPDYSDLPSMVHSITAKWPDPKEKC